MSEKLMTIDEVLMKLWLADSIHEPYPPLIDEAKAHLARIMEAERLQAKLEENQRQLEGWRIGTRGMIPKRLSDNIQRVWIDRIAQLTHQAQAGGEE